MPKSFDIKVFNRNKLVKSMDIKLIYINKCKWILKDNFLLICKKNNLEKMVEINMIQEIIQDILASFHVAYDNVKYLYSYEY